MLKWNISEKRKILAHQFGLLRGKEYVRAVSIGAWVTLTRTRSGADEYTCSTSIAQPGRQRPVAVLHGPLDAAARTAYRAARAEVAEV